MHWQQLKFILTNNPKKLGAIVLCIGMFVLLLNQITSFIANNRAPVLENQVVVSNKRPALSINSPVFQKALFGSYMAVNLNAIKESSLDVDLVGILFDNHNPSDSQVLLRVANGEEQTFKVGDVLPGGAVIKEIRSDGIVILRDNELESLSLPKNELKMAPPPQED